MNFSAGTTTLSSGDNLLGNFQVKTSREAKWPQGGGGKRISGKPRRGGQFEG